MKKRRKLVSATEKTALKGKILRLVTSHECNIGDNKVRISEKQCQLYLTVNSKNIEYLFKHIVSQNTIPAQWYSPAEQFHLKAHCASACFTSIHHQFEGYSAEE